MGSTPNKVESVPDSRDNTGPVHTPRRFAVVLISGLIAASSLAIAPPASANGCIGGNFPSGDGSAGSPYEIADAGDLVYLASDTNCFGYNYRQTANIVLTGAWTTPIGDSTDSFAGTYDGGGFSISNLNISLPTTGQVGLFGFIRGATLTGINISSGSITGGDLVGGLVGQAANSSITRSSSAASVSGGSNVGGLVGSIGAATPGTASISHSYATGDVTGRVSGSTGNYIGGLAGTVYQMTVSDVYATGAVSGNLQTAGLFGEYASSTLTRGYVIGRVTNSGGSSAGVVGQITGTLSTSNFTWNVTTTGQTQWGGPIEDNVVGNTTEAMKSISTYRDLGWSIGSLWTGNTTWVICPQANDGYPFLSAFYTAQTAPCINRSGPPPDVMQQVGRAGDQTCVSAGTAEMNIGGVASGGWGQSWAQWMNGGTGGFVCNRTLYYNVQYGRWEVRT